MAGVLLPHSGKGVFQTIPASALQATGKSLSRLVLLPRGPRHWGQSSACVTF
jgi:hypothetical protein